MRKCNVITICLPELYDTLPEKNLERSVALLDSFKTLKPDLICLPETFLEISVNVPRDFKQLADMCFPVLSGKARELNSYIVAGVHEIIDGKTYNSAWLINRGGNLAGRYIKYYPVDYELTRTNVVPGSEVPVFETDFGKLGILICFDIDFPRIWTEMGKKGAEIVAWISAYDGGYPLNAYAAINDYYVVSSVRAYHSRIIDKSGKELAISSRWANWAQRSIGLDKTLFHIDGQFPKLNNIQKQLGDKITLETFDEEGRFTIESNDPEWPVERVRNEFGLKTFAEFHEKIEVMLEEHRHDYMKG